MAELKKEPFGTLLYKAGSQTDKQKSFLRLNAMEASAASG
jgi:hypothetical protein